MRPSSTYFNDDSSMTQFPVIYSSKTQNHKSHHNHKPIIVNLGETQYAVLQEVCEQLEWRIQYCDNKNWDIKWTDSAVSSQFLNKMSQHQKVNHFPGMSILSRKNNLTKCVQRMQQKYLQDYDFYPRTFLLPFDKHKLSSYVQQVKKMGLKKCFIVKPQAGSQGRGIFITPNINQIQQYSHCVVQKYITNPLLYKNLKFDLRVYALVAGCDPLRIYIYNQGLTRFATEKYKAPCEENFDNLYMHLTNYAINKDHPNYIYNDSVQNLSYGHKKSLAQFFQTLKNLGYKAHQFWADIKDIIIKTMISGQPHLQHQYRMSQPHNLKNDMCFQVLGFDFMFDSNNKCHLLQINHTPSFTTDTPLDQLVKSNLIRDTLNLMNITSKTRDKVLSQLKSENERRVFTGKSKKYTPEQRLRKIEQLQQERDQYEKNNLGSFQKIYPCKHATKQNKYEQFLDYSLNCYKETTSGKQRQSPTKFRVKKLVTSHTNDEQDFKNDESLTQNRSNYKNDSNYVKRNLSSAAKINTKSQRQNSLRRQNVVLNPQKVMLLQSTNRKINPIVVGSIVSRGSSYVTQDQTLNSIKRTYESKVQNWSLKQSKDYLDRQKMTTGMFLKTRQQQSTMFSKFLQKGKA